MMTRREALKKAAMATVACAATSALNTAKAQSSPATPSIDALTAPKGPFWLPPLPYAYDALEPFIDAETLRIHHDVIHANNIIHLNEVVTDPKIASWPIERLLRNLDAAPENVRAAIRNYGGGHYNHSIFWKMMKKNGSAEPGASLAEAIQKTFTSFSIFKDIFAKAALSQFGSGWAWLTADANGTIRIEVTSNQDSPLSQGRMPLLGIDVWEHAYYLKYQSKRLDYISAWFNVANWEYASEQYIEAERML